MKAAVDPLIAIIIVGYKSRQDLPDCLASIYKSSYQNFSIIFVDNHSKDDSLEYLEKEHPNVIRIAAEENLGFAKANNLGIAKALKLETDYCFLLNPDTIIAPTCLEELVKNTNQNTVLQPLILLHDNGTSTNLVNTYGNPLHYLGFSYAGGNKEPLPEGKGKEIALASGAAVLIPRQILEKVGLFDDSFFMYHEDVDLSWRIRLQGFQIRSLYAAKVWHKYTFSKNSKKFYFVERNRLLFILKNYQLKTILLILPLGIITELFLLLYAFTQKSFLAKVHSWGSFLAMSPEAIKSRRRIQTTRTLTDKELFPFFSAKLKFSEVNSLPINLYNILSRGYWNIIRKI